MSVLSIATVTYSYGTPTTTPCQWVTTGRHSPAKGSLFQLSQEPNWAKHQWCPNPLPPTQATTVKGLAIRNSAFPSRGEMIPYFSGAIIRVLKET